MCELSDLSNSERKGRDSCELTGDPTGACRREGAVTASTIIVWDKRVQLAGGPTSGPGVTNVLRVSCDGSTPLKTLAAKIVAAAGDDKIDNLRIFAQGGSVSGGVVAL